MIEVRLAGAEISIIHEYVLHGKLHIHAIIIDLVIDSLLCRVTRE